MYCCQSELAAGDHVSSFQQQLLNLGSITLMLCRMLFGMPFGMLFGRIGTCTATLVRRECVADCREPLLTSAWMVMTSARTEDSNYCSAHLNAVKAQSQQLELMEVTPA